MKAEKILHNNFFKNIVNNSVVELGHERGGQKLMKCLMKMMMMMMMFFDV